MATKRISMAEKMASRVTPVDEPVPETHLEGSRPTSLQVVDDPPASVVSPPVTPAVAPSDIANPEHSAAQPARATRRTVSTSGKRAPRPSVLSEPATAAMGIDVGMELHKRLVSFRNSARHSYHRIVLDAVESVYAELPSLVAKALDVELDSQPSSLFERSAALPVSLDGREPRETHTVRMTEKNRETLNAITAEVGAPSRNFMICVALNAYLPAG